MTESNPEAARGIGVVGAAAIGVGGMVGGGIFAVLGTAVMLAGGGTHVAFALAGLVAPLTAHSYAKLSVAYPNSGGTIVFLDRAFGIELATGTLNSVLWLSYLVTIALYAAAFGSYGLTFFTSKPPWLLHTLMSAAIAVPAFINVLDSSIVSKSETAVVVIKLCLLALVIAAGAREIQPDRLAFQTWASPSSLVMGGMTIFVAYEGFELIANAAEDVRNPAKTLLRALYLSVGFVVILYVLVAVVTVGSVPAATIAKAKDYALAAAAEPALGHAGFVMVAVSALLATFSAINALSRRTQHRRQSIRVRTRHPHLCRGIAGAPRPHVLDRASRASRARRIGGCCRRVRGGVPQAFRTTFRCHPRRLALTQVREPR